LKCFEHCLTFLEHRKDLFLDLSLTAEFLKLLLFSTYTLLLLTVLLSF
jgi:hypothetical protein